MTQYFEVLDRDGVARHGTLRLSEPVDTPAIVDDHLRETGSRWVRDPDVPPADESVLTVLPHRALPRGTAAEVADAFDEGVPEYSGPSAAVVSPQTAADHPVDAYVLAGAPSYAGHAEAFVDAILTIRQATPPDTALYLPGIATPANVSTLVAAGADLVDTDRAYLKGTQGFYLTTDGEHFLEDLTELPCACPACRRGRAAFDREACAEHNVSALTVELARVRERIRSGRLREYLEGQVRHEAWLTATMRRLDRHYAYLEQHAPVIRRAELLAASEESMRRPEIQRFAERITGRYRCRFEQPLVLVPCSARKPYSQSQSHRQFREAIDYRAHLVSITSPIGVVPQELELTYPAQHYEAVVTGEWTAGEVDFVADILSTYLERTDYPRHIAHVPQDYRPICERVEDQLDATFEYTVADHPTDDESLAALSEALHGEEQYRKRERQHHTVRAIADVQFGDGAGNQLFDEMETHGRHPRLRVFDNGDATSDASVANGPADPIQLATLVPQYGLLAFTLAGARQWAASDAPTLEVTIDPFVPSGSVLAPGVREASPGIRVGDEVLVSGPEALAVGRAEMNGPEMEASTRGVAVDVRHCEER